MQEIDAKTTARYLHASGRFPAAQEFRVSELSGGVSNIVLRVDTPGQQPFVIKQCRHRLRTAMEWYAPLERIWTECAALRLLAEILPSNTIPLILFEDRENYLFAMTCAPRESVTWKSQLMDGQINPWVATTLGKLLATIHAEAPKHPALAASLADTALFTELRIDPYYHTTARRQPALIPRFEALIASMNRPTDERTLVLGDFSPKNILVHDQELILLDFECAHAGDPAFDLGFFLTHLLLKAIRAKSIAPATSISYLNLTTLFWTAYLERLSARGPIPATLIPRACLHTAACCLARVDGKSPVEYLDDEMRAIVRSFACALLTSEPTSWTNVLDTLVGYFDR